MQRREREEVRGENGEKREVRGKMTRCRCCHHCSNAATGRGGGFSSGCGGRLNNFPVHVSAAELRPLSVSLYCGPTIFPAFSGTLGPSSTDDLTIFQFFITVTILVFPRQP